MSVGLGRLPCVAQRVWPMPIDPLSGSAPSLGLRVPVIVIGPCTNPTPFSSLRSHEFFEDFVGGYRPHDRPPCEGRLHKVDLPGTPDGSHVDVKRNRPPQADAKGIPIAVDLVAGLDAHEVTEGEESDVNADR